MGKSRWLVVSVPDSSKRLVKYHKSKKKAEVKPRPFFRSEYQPIKVVALD